VHTRINTYTYLHICTPICIYICTHMYFCVFVYIYIRIYILINVHINMHMCIKIYKYTFICTHVYKCIWIHVHIHLNATHLNALQRIATLSSTLPVAFARKTCMQQHIYLFIYIHIYTHTCTHIYISIGIYTNLHRHKFIFVHIHICLYLWCSRERTACSSSIWAPNSLSIFDVYSFHHIPVNRNFERWCAGVETQKNVRREIGGWGRVPFNEPYAPSLSTIYDGA